MRQRCFYLVLAIIGCALPYYFLIAFLSAHGLDGRLFLHDLFGNSVSTFFAVDLLISSVVFVHFLRREAARHSIRGWWPYLIALLTVGLSLALPLFLYVRESRLAQSESSPGALAPSGGA